MPRSLLRNNQTPGQIEITSSTLIPGDWYFISVGNRSVVGVFRRPFRLQIHSSLHGIPET